MEVCSNSFILTCDPHRVLRNQFIVVSHLVIVYCPISSLITKPCSSSNSTTAQSVSATSTIRSCAKRAILCTASRNLEVLRCCFSLPQPVTSQRLQRMPGTERSKVHFLLHPGFSLVAPISLLGFWLVRASSVDFGSVIYRNIIAKSKSSAKPICAI